MEPLFLPLEELLPSITLPMARKETSAAAPAEPAVAAERLDAKPPAPAERTAANPKACPGRSSSIMRPPISTRQLPERHRTAAVACSTRPPFRPPNSRRSPGFSISCSAPATSWLMKASSQPRKIRSIRRALLVVRFSLRCGAACPLGLLGEEVGEFGGVGVSCWPRSTICFGFDFGDRLLLASDWLRRFVVWPLMKTLSL
mmetsp:Transcript_63503/g.112952  ORF Transcript_63503/g.112952 Transcript_63503/m.112952 type:complete len:201 (-) Transcript_63503:591-1193(-)